MKYSYLAKKKKKKKYMYDFGHKFCDSVLVHYFVEAYFYVYHVNYVENSLDCIGSSKWLIIFCLIFYSAISQFLIIL
jgi:hypothetical protein